MPRTTTRRPFRRLGRGVYGARSRNRRRRPLRRRTRFTVAKTLGYKGFHCFKETTNGRMNIGPISATQPYNFKANDIKVNELSLAPTTAATWRFNINQVPQWETYKALFQQFRITGVKIKFYPAITQSMDLDTSGGGLPTDQISLGENVPSLVYKFDPNDTINWTQWSECMSSDPTIRQTNRPLSVYVKPKMMVANYQSTNVQNDSVVTNSVKWCNFDKVSVQTDAPTQPAPYTYSGLDMGCYNTTSRMDLNFIITYYFQCKTPA